MRPVRRSGEGRSPVQEFLFTVPLDKRVCTDRNWSHSTGLHYLWLCGAVGAAVLGAGWVVWVWNQICILDITKCAVWEVVKGSLAGVMFI